MREIATILVPIFFSIFAFLIFAPLIYWLQRKGIPGGVSISLVILFFVLVFIGMGILLTGSLLQLGSWAPANDIELTENLEKLTQYLPSAGFSFEEVLRNITTFAFSLTTEILTVILNAGTTVGIIIVTTMFLLLDIAVPPGKVQKEAKKRPFLLSRTNEFGSMLMDYILIRTGINLIGGIGTALILFIGGVDFAILWGMLTFLLGFIPYLGFFLAVLPPMIFALFEYGITGALAVFAGIWLINALVENVLFPSLAGKGLKLSPSIVFLSLIYWTYVLGTAGSLIAVPLTMIVKMIIESSDGMRWLAKLMEYRKENPAE